MKSNERDYEPAGSLYQSILGPEWKGLSPVVRKGFSGEGVRRGRGAFTVQRGRGLLARLYCWLGRLPPAGRDVEVELTVTPIAEGEIWHRSFGGHILESSQINERGLLTESFGPVVFQFKLAVEDGQLLFDTVSTYLCLGPLRIPVPTAFALGGRANNWEEARGEMGVSVEITAPLTGLICSYNGVIEINTDEPLPNSVSIFPCI